MHLNQRAEVELETPPGQQAAMRGLMELHLLVPLSVQKAVMQAHFQLAQQTAAHHQAA
jgi:hypothetical protein